VTEKYLTLSPAQRYLIAVSGIPGSGKTSLTRAVVSGLNARSNKPFAAALPMDGFHYTRAHLSAMPDPVTAHARRGAAFTFDAGGLLVIVKKLRQPLSADSETIRAPSFDHALKDPVEDDIDIPVSVKVVVIEGNYISLSTGIWRSIVKLMDECWFVNVNFDTAGARLAFRHAKAGIVENEEQGWKRARENDLPNGKEIVDGRWSEKITEWIESKEDAEWKEGP
jgi:pantothenate kinase